MNMYDEIARNLLSTDDGQCVLVLGPELSIGKNGLFYKSQFKKLADENSRYINNYFEEQNIFSFTDEAGEDAMYGNIEGFYAGAGDDTLLSLIARIKFPLIINVCPDKALNRVYKRNRIPFVYSYFCKNPHVGNQVIEYTYKDGEEEPDYTSFDSIPRPSRKKPVIYNIFGDYEVKSSMVYDHGTFYQMIEALMGPNAITGKINEFLVKANCIIFLGFDFNSWHYQLLLHKMGLGNNKNTSKYLGQNNQANVKVVVKNYFKLRSTEENPTHTIEGIIKALEASEDSQKSLRDLNSKNEYGVYISYAWKDKPVDILGIVGKMLNSSDLSKSQKKDELQSLLAKSGKYLPQEEDIEWLFSQGKNDAGLNIEEWYHSLKPVEQLSKPTLHFDREYVVDKIQEKLTQKGIKIYRDKNEMTFGDSIDSFMNRIGTGKAVIRIVSDKYLKSRYCMDEALRMYKSHTSDKRIFTIVLPDEVDIDFYIKEKDKEAQLSLDIDGVLRYKQYWQTLTEDIYKKLDSTSASVIDKERIKKNFFIYIDICDYIDAFITEVKNELHLQLHESNSMSVWQNDSFANQEQQIDNFIDAIITKLKS